MKTAKMHANTPLAQRARRPVDGFASDIFVGNMPTPGVTSCAKERASSEGGGGSGITCVRLHVGSKHDKFRIVVVPTVNLTMKYRQTDAGGLGMPG